MKFLLSIFLFFVSIFSFCGCQNSIPKGNSVNTKIIYDYENENLLPSQKLSFFLEMQSDVRRVDYINLYHEKSGYRWIISNPLISKVDKVYYTGYSNCVVSTNSFFSKKDNIIPNGDYNVYYMDAKGREFVQSFNLEYEQDFASLKCSDMIKTLSEKDYSVFIGLYSQEGNLIFYGEPKQEWQVSKQNYSYNTNSIFNYDTKVSFFRIFYEYENQVFVMPKIEKGK